MANDLILAEAARLEPTALVSFFEIDVTELGGGVLRLTPYVRGLVQDILWQGVLYSGFPLEFEGNEFKGQGTLPRPVLRLGNIAGAFTSFCLLYNNLVGAKVTRRRTFARYLDGQPDADPTAALPDDIFEIDRKAREDRQVVEFELAPAMEVEGVMLPRRQVQSSLCAWMYRSPECGFTEDRAVATKENVPFSTPQNFRGEWTAGATYVHRDVVWRQITKRAKRFYFAKNVAGNTGKQPPDATYWGEDLCSLTLNGGCRLRFPGPKPFGGFPGTRKVQGTT